MIVVFLDRKFNMHDHFMSIIIFTWIMNMIFT